MGIRLEVGTLVKNCAGFILPRWVFPRGGRDENGSSIPEPLRASCIVPNGDIVPLGSFSQLRGDEC